jgi:hypothetical protein
MGKFKDYRSLNGSNSRVTKKSKGIATPVQVLDLVAQPTGHFITVRKSEMREPITNRLVARKLVSVTESMSDDEKAMYIQLCQLAAQA